jgi:hypothetical protein
MHRNDAKKSAPPSRGNANSQRGWELAIIEAITNDAMPALEQRRAEVG